MTVPRIAYLPRQTKTIASLGAVLMRLEGKTMLVCKNNLQFGKHPTKVHLSAMLNVIKGCWEMVEIIILSWMLDWTKTSHLVTQTYIGPLRDHCVDWYIKTYKFWACISTYQFYVCEKSWCYGFISHIWKADVMVSYHIFELWIHLPKLTYGFNKEIWEIYCLPAWHTASGIKGKLKKEKNI